MGPNQESVLASHLLNPPAELRVIKNLYFGVQGDTAHSHPVPSVYGQGMYQDSCAISNRGRSHSDGSLGPGRRPVCQRLPLLGIVSFAIHSSCRTSLPSSPPGPLDSVVPRWMSGCLQQGLVHGVLIRACGTGISDMSPRGRKSGPCLAPFLHGTMASGQLRERDSFRKGRCKPGCRHD